MCYFLASPDADQCEHEELFKKEVQTLIDKIEGAQHEDGYLNIYFSVVDTAGKGKNFRDMHELCEFRDRFATPDDKPALSNRQHRALVGGSHRPLSSDGISPVSRHHDTCR